MGTRVHKRLGWGLKDIKIKDGEICDPRFKSGNIYGRIDDAIKRVIEVSKSKNGKDIFQNILSDFSGSADDDIKLMMLPCMSEISSLDSDYAYNKFTYNDKILVITPIEFSTDWYHYDDTIDYYESGCVAKDKVKDLTSKCGIYPWTGMEHIPGTEKSDIKNVIFHVDGGIDPAQYNQLVGRWDKKYPPIAKGKDLDILLSNYRPVIPGSIILTVYFADIFVDWKASLNQFRPLLYTYWN